jgi:hypothetical protein
MYSKELMYQQVVRRFAHFNAIQLSDPAPLSELIMLALKEEDVDPKCNENDDLIEKITEVTYALFRLISHVLWSLYISLSICFNKLTTKCFETFNYFNSLADYFYFGRRSMFLMCLLKEIEVKT